MHVMNICLVLCVAILSIVLANPVPESIDMLRIPLKDDKVSFFKLLYRLLFGIC